jgi:hypothetical protein
MSADWKLAVAVREDLATWQKLNVTAFVVSGIGSSFPDLVGQPYRDASAQQYLSMFALPVLVYAGDAQGVRRGFTRAVERGLAVAIYTDDLFKTDNDVANRAQVAAVAGDELVVAGFAVTGDRKQVDKVFDKLRLHP